MSNRKLTRAALLFILIVMTAPRVHVAAFDEGRHAARGQQARGQAGRTNDGAGRSVKTTVSTPEGEKVTVSVTYDGRDRAQSVVRDDGTRIDLVYDAAGLWQGFSFADGGKMLFKRSASGEIVGFTRVAKSAGQQGPGVNRVNYRRVGSGAPREDGCASATAAAVAAAANAVAACLSGPSIQCATAMAAAGVAAARAYEACKDSSMLMESAA
jgi:YD repeat-containing protein